MGPCMTRIFYHIPANMWPFKNAYIRDLNRHIYGLEAHTYRM